MANNLPLKTFTGALLFALLLSVAAPLVARAQDETATPTPTIESSATPTEIPPTATLEPPTASETSASDTETPTATLESPTETPSETATIDLSATATATLGSETPTSTTTETLSPTPTPTLGTPLQAAVFNTSDVIWCPATVAVPQEAGGMGCTLPQSSLEALRAVLALSQPIVDGTIWVGKDYVSALNVTFDGSILTMMAARKLTFKGGWITTGGTIDPSGSDVGHWIHIQNWANDVAVNTLNIDGVTSGHNLQVTTNGKITLSLINSDDPVDGNAALLNNTAGSADVILTSSEFKGAGAGDCGLVVASKGVITLTGVDASQNVGCGAVTVNKATADGNDLDGLHIEPTPGNITLMCGFFTNNTLDGVDVNTPAIFKRVGVVASGNGSMDIRFTGGTEIVVRNCP